MDGKKFRLRGSAPGGGDKRNNKFKNFGFIAILILFGLIIFAAFSQPSTLKDVPYSQVISEANSGKISEIIVNGNQLLITPKGESKPTEKSFKEEGSSIYEQGLQQGKVSLTNKPRSDTGNVWLT